MHPRDEIAARELGEHARVELVGLCRLRSSTSHGTTSIALRDHATAMDHLEGLIAR
jgi:hypothetical protein